MEYLQEIRQLLDETKLETEILASATAQYNAGLELVDPKVFLTVLRTIGEKSRKVLQFINNQRNITVGYVSSADCHLDRSVLSAPFSKVGLNLVYKPLNFEGNITAFTDFLKENEKGMLLTAKALHDSNVVLSEYITNPKLLSNIDIKRLPSLAGIDTLPTDFADFFKGIDGVDRAKLDELYDSYSDFGGASQNITALTKTMQGVDIKSIKKSVTELYDTIDIIMDLIHKNNIQVSKPAAKSLGNMIYSLADWTAIYSLYVSKLVAVSKSHVSTANKLNSFI